MLEAQLDSPSALMPTASFFPTKPHTPASLPKLSEYEENISMGGFFFKLSTCLITVMPFIIVVSLTEGRITGHSKTFSEF